MTFFSFLATSMLKPVLKWGEGRGLGRKRKERDKKKERERQRGRQREKERERDKNIERERGGRNVFSGVVELKKEISKEENKAIICDFKA